MKLPLALKAGLSTTQGGREPARVRVVEAPETSTRPASEAPIDEAQEAEPQEERGRRGWINPAA